MKTTLMYALAALATAGAVVGGGQVAQMAEDFSAQKQHNKQQRAAIHEAVASGDYAAWDALVPEDAQIREIIHQENFNRLQELHELRESGDKEAAKELQEELGIPERGKHGFKRGHEHSKEDQAEREAKRAELEAAIAAGDYEQFVSLLPEQHQQEFRDKITVENFSEFTRMHELMQSGDKDGAEEIRASLGLEKREHKHDGEKRHGKHPTPQPEEQRETAPQA